jgi:hypothetical protein
LTESAEPQAEAQPQENFMTYYRPPFIGRAYYDDIDFYDGKVAEG